MTLQNCKINGKIDAKPSKSIFQRLLALSLLSDNPTIIENPSFCDDSITTMNILQSIGCQIIKLDNKIKVIPNIINEDRTLNCNESALAIRMFPPILSLFDNKYILVATKTLTKRPLFEIDYILKQLGAFVQTNNGYPPIQIRGPIKAKNITLDASQTSQFLSGLLIALPRLEHYSEIVAKHLSSKPYVEITLSLVTKFGGNIEVDEHNHFHCMPSRYNGGEFFCENDWSNSAVFLIAGAIGGKCEVVGIDINSVQGDKVIIDILNRVGAKVQINDNSITIEKSELKPFEFWANDFPDLVPFLCILALNCEGKSKIYGVERLKYKETNRLQKIIQIFLENNLNICYENNCLEITGKNYSIEYLDTEGDHRFAMVAALLSINNPKPIKIFNHQAVSKSYPEFFDDFRKIQYC